PFFDEALDHFEAGRDSLYAFFPRLFPAIRPDREEARVKERLRRAAVESIGDARQSERKSAPPPASAELRALLIAATRKLLAGDYDGARLLLEQVLERDASNANALYGLAQIAGRAEDFDRALELYERAGAAAGRESWIAAWSFVRRGKILEFQGERDRARAEWQRALGLEGDLRGAAEAARGALGTTRSKP